jgi:hypothetical protein
MKTRGGVKCYCQNGFGALAIMASAAILSVILAVVVLSLIQVSRLYTWSLDGIMVDLARG